MNKLVIIVDYGSGNIFSAEKSFQKIINDNKINARVKISKNINDIRSATHLVLPGQGAFSTCMKGLQNTPGMISELSKTVLIDKKPFLGICVGMQLLATRGFENGEYPGLGWIEGDIIKIPQNNLKLPHMGWNEVVVKNSKNNLIKSKKTKDYYFVHSYYFKCKNKINELANTFYGINFASIISKENIYGVQFHPEKSSEQGLEIIKNFIML